MLYWDFVFNKNIFYFFIFGNIKIQVDDGLSMFR